MLDAIAKIFEIIASITNTTWGILILLASMWIAVHYSKEVGYYFAGVGSTLAGISSVKSATLAKGAATTLTKEE